MNSVLKISTCLISKDSVSYDDSNKKVLGKMKDEVNGVKLYEFVGLKSQMYLLISCDGEEINKAKGVNLLLRHSEYVEVLFGKKVVRYKMKRIQSKLHRIGTYKVNKISLSCLMIKDIYLMMELIPWHMVTKILSDCCYFKSF